MTGQIDQTLPVIAENKPFIDHTNKKNPKKLKYKDLMNQIIKCERSDEEIQKEHRQKILSSIGGGAFTKIEKI